MGSSADALDAILGDNPEQTLPPPQPGVPRVIITPSRSADELDKILGSSANGRAAPGTQPPGPTLPPVSQGQAAWTGVKAGATANFSDELSGLLASSGYANLPIDQWEKPPANAKEWADQVIKIYEQARDDERTQQKASEAQWPRTYLGGEVGGGVASMALGPEARIASEGAKVAPGLLTQLGERATQGFKTGAVYGGVQGAGSGEDATERAIGAGTGMVAGGVTGGVLPPALTATNAAAKYFIGRPISTAASVIRGLVNDRAEATGRTTSTLAGAQQRMAAEYQRLIANGVPEPEAYNKAYWNAFREDEWNRLKAQGEPVSNLDLGGQAGHDLAQSGYITSPEGKEAIDKTLSRKDWRASRIADTLRQLVPGRKADPFLTREKIEAEYNANRGPAYEKAMADGDRTIWTPSLDNLSRISSVQDAMHAAGVDMADRSVLKGGPSKSPFVFDKAEGKFTLSPDAISSPPGGATPTYGGEVKPDYVAPNLRYWDAVKKYLDKKDPSAAKALRTHLDSQVPSYADARGVAAARFGANDPLEAGENAVGFKGDYRAVASTVAKMGPDEKALFQEGFIGKMAYAIEHGGDRNQLTNQIFKPGSQARMLIQAVFGDEGTKQVEARVRIENIMGYANRIQGGSDTVKKLVAGGLAGGTIGAVTGGFDIEHIRNMAETGAGIAGAPQIIRNTVIGYVDKRVAARVAEMMASDSPIDLSRVTKLIASEPKLSAAIRELDTALASYVGRRAVTGGVSAIDRATGALPAAADEDQRQPQP